ncbi:AAA family ATPase [Candidatus Woesearchaeota archaeon]|nr:AAA family ATPase [Candidatus Woesearchaeota archaeon]
MRKLIMLYGFPLSGKSTVAKKLKDSFSKKNIDCEIIKSVSTRFKVDEHIKFTKKSIDETNEETRREKDDSYRKLCDLVESSDKDIIILDATFHKQYRRNWVYDIAEKNDYELYVLWTIFNSKEVINNYLDERKKNPDFKDKVLDSIDQYECMVEQTDKLDDSEFDNIKIIKFVREKKDISFYNCEENGFAKEISKIIKN